MKRLFTFLLVLGISTSFAQLTFTGGPLESGYTRSIYAGNGVILAGVANELVRSDDGGETWSQVQGLPQGISPDCFADDGNTIIMGTNNGDRSYRSTDGGLTWEAITNGMPNIMGFPSAVPTHAVSLDGTVMMCGTNFIRRTTDQGDNWGTMSIDGLSYGLSETEGEIWAMPSGNVWYTTDGGDNWTQTSSTPTIGFGTSVSCVLKDGDRHWIGTNMSGGVGLHYTEDYGDSYTEIGGLSVIYDIIKHNDILYCTTILGMYSSSDNGESWSQISDFSFNDAGSGKMDMDGDVIWIATATGPAKYDTVTEAAEVVGLPTSQVADIAVGNGMAMAITTGSLYSSPTAGESYDWTEVENELFTGQNFEQIYYDDGSFYLITSVFAGNSLFESADGGATWTEILIDESDPSPLQMISFNPIVVATTSGTSFTIWYSLDDGATFSQGDYVPASFPTLFGLTNMGTTISSNQNNGFGFSTDNGQTWTNYSNPYYDFSGAKVVGWGDRFIALFGDIFSDQYVIAESTDGGENWQELNAGLPEGELLASDESIWRVGDVVYLQLAPTESTEGEIYSLTESATSWSSTGNALPNVISNMTGDENGNIYYSTQGNGVWTESGSTSISAGQQAKKLKLFPNPSRGLVQLEGLREGQEIEIYDSFGKLVLSERVSSDRMMMDLSENSRGVYFIRIPDTGYNAQLILH